MLQSAALLDSKTLRKEEKKFDIYICVCCIPLHLIMNYREVLLPAAL